MMSPFVHDMVVGVLVMFLLTPYMILIILAIRGALTKDLQK